MAACVFAGLLGAVQCGLLYYKNNPQVCQVAAVVLFGRAMGGLTREQPAQAVSVVVQPAQQAQLLTPAQLSR